MCNKCNKCPPMRNYDVCAICFVEQSQAELENYKQRLREKKIAALIAQMAARENELIRL